MTGIKKIPACLVLVLAVICNSLPSNASTEAAENWPEAMQAIEDEQWAGAM